jgi:hypothetical protein
MGLIGLVIVLVLVGVALYLLNLIPMDAIIKRIIQVLVIVVVVLWIIQALGLLDAGPTIRLR